jgi:hypothetical protein
MKMVEDAKNSTPPTMTAESKSLECSSRFVFVTKSNVHGIGVFAAKNFQTSETIETFPIVPLYFRTHYQGDIRILDYSVVKQCDCEECKRHGNVIYLRLGYGGIYNHQDVFNAELIMDYKNMIGTCVATKPIQVNDEIFINYGINYRFPEGKISIRQ